MEQTTGRRHRQQGINLPAAARLSEQHHVPRITAELSNIVADPLEREDKVAYTQIACIGKAATKLLQVQEPESAETMIHGNHDHVSQPRKVLSVICPQFLA